jgi:hypothetical protein
MTFDNRGLRLFMAGLALALAARAADAADIPTKAPAAVVAAPAPVEGWWFQVTPYFWAAGLKGNVRPGPNAPLAQVDASFTDILDDLGFAAMATIEARKGRFGLVGDLIYLSLTSTARGPLGFVGAQLKDKTFLAQVNAAYRVVDNGAWWLDLEAGARIWAMDMDLTFSIAPPIGASRTFSLSKSWVDPIIGVRARANLGQGFFVQGYADVGGFGVSSDSTWQVAGLLGYQYSPAISFLAGYRYLAVDYDRNGFVWDVDLHGPIFALAWKLN